MRVRKKKGRKRDDSSLRRKYHHLLVQNPMTITMDDLFRSKLPPKEAKLLCVCGCLARKTLWYPNKSRCLACVKSLAFFYTRCVCVLCYYSNTPTHNNNDGQVVLAVYSNGAQVDARLISHDSLVIDYYLQVPPRRLFSKKKKIFSLFFSYSLFL